MQTRELQDRQTHTANRIRTIAQWYEQLSPQSLQSIPAVYAEQARFKDPFQDVRGRNRIHAVLGKMFQDLHNPRFVVIDTLSGEDGRGLLRWDFHFARQGKPLQAYCIHGATHIQLDADGLIQEHIDYWDASEGVYEHLPLLGTVLRFIKGKIASNH